MKISDTQIRGAIQAFVRQVDNRTRPPQAEAAPTRAETDRVSLSAEAEEMQAIQKAVLALPDIRPDKVEPIRAAIESGEYRVSADQVAAQIIGRSIADKLEIDKQG